MTRIFIQGTDKIADVDVERANMQPTPLMAGCFVASAHYKVSISPIILLLILFELRYFHFCSFSAFLIFRVIVLRFQLCYNSISYNVATQHKVDLEMELLNLWISLV